MEISLILLWAVWIGRAYLNFDTQIVPAGHEYGSAIQTHHLWTRFQACGVCALWDGSERGGFPAFVDTLSASLHPLVAVTTLLFGVVNGSKVALVACLVIAGIAQWWLAVELNLARLPRLWGALMVMVGGHLSGKMELGVFSLVLSTAMASLTFPAAIRLARTGKQRDIVLLAVTLALLAVSGQGYLQLGFLASSPTYLILLVDDRPGFGYVRLRFVLAAGLAVLLAAPFLVPLIHFWPHFSKATDPTFSAGQPLHFYILNLVMGDRGFLYSTQLDKLPYPYLYTMFIGWIPLCLALLALRYARGNARRPLLFLAANGAMAIFVGSTLPLRWIQPVFPALAGLRFAPLIGGLVVPPLIALATYSLDQFLRLPWSLAISMSLDRNGKPLRRQRINIKWLILLPLLLALARGYTFARLWLYTHRLDDDVFTLLEALKTPTLQWVEPPFGEHYFIEPAISMGLKLSPGIMAWQWKDRPFPPMWLEARRTDPPLGAIHQQDVVDISIYAYNIRPYAIVTSADGQSVECSATGIGGWIEVTCETSTPGLLSVLENMGSGWYAWRDGQQVPLLDRSGWLLVEAPPGKHTYLFRYLPWDVPLGLVLFAIGSLFCGLLWYKEAAVTQEKAR